MPIHSTFIKHNKPVVVLDRMFGQALTHSLVEQAREFGWQLLNLEFTRGVIPTDPAPIGAVLGCWPSSPVAKKLNDLGCPKVFVSSIKFAPELKVAYVRYDLYATGVMAAEHFVERNFRDLAYVGKKPLANSADLYHGFKERGRELGCTMHFLGLQEGPAETPDEVTEKAKRQAQKLGDWLSALPKPVGLLGYHRRMAGELFTACQTEGLSIPEEIAIIATETTPQANELAPVPLSSFDANDELTGKEALVLLKRLIDGEPVPDAPIQIPPKGIIERQSTNILAVADSRVARAVRYLWDNLNEPITNDDVARDVDIPLSTLKRLFLMHLNRSMTAELRRKRLEVAGNLLKNSKLTVEEVGIMVGICSKSYFYKVFTEEFGVSPNRFRQRQKEV